MAYKGFDLAGKVSLITGGNGGIGFGLAETLKVMGHVDNCVANSGVSGRGKGSILEMDYEEWRRVMRVNLDGVFFTFQAAARHMVERGKGGSLVAMASTGDRGRGPLQ